MKRTIVLKYDKNGEPLDEAVFDMVNGEIKLVGRNVWVGHLDKMVQVDLYAFGNDYGHAYIAFEKEAWEVLSGSDIEMVPINKYDV